MRTRLPLKSTLLLACLLGLPIVAFWVGGRFHELRRVGKDHRSDSKLSQLKCALLAYHDEYGAFPPTKHRSGHDGPMHSWRVLLVPHTSEYYRKRYAQYDFSQEWNSPDNLRALDGMPCFSYFSLNGDNETANYLTVALATSGLRRDH